jgi:hypothetical protein
MALRQMVFRLNRAAANKRVNLLVLNRRSFLSS